MADSIKENPQPTGSEQKLASPFRPLVWILVPLFLVIAYSVFTR